MKLDEASLVKACLKHDQKACRQLYDSFAPQMLGVCMRYAQSREAAEDILHDGFIKVFENLHKLRDVSQLAAWIRSVMVNTAVSAFRHECKKNAATDLFDDDDFSYGSDDIYGNIDIEVIMQAVQELPDTYRLCFNLCEIEGYSFSEVSKQLGIGESGVRSNICRARKILSQKLSKLL